MIAGQQTAGFAAKLLNNAAYYLPDALALLLLAAFAGRRLAAAFFGAAEAEVVFRRAEVRFLDGPAAARAASSASASFKVSSSGDVPLGSEAFVWPSVT